MEDVSKLALVSDQLYREFIYCDSSPTPHVRDCLWPASEIIMLLRY